MFLTLPSYLWHPAPEHHRHCRNSFPRRHPSWCICPKGPPIQQTNRWMRTNRIPSVPSIFFEKDKIFHQSQIWVCLKIGSSQTSLLKCLCKWGIPDFQNFQTYPRWCCQILTGNPDIFWQKPWLQLQTFTPIYSTLCPQGSIFGSFLLKFRTHTHPVSPNQKQQQNTCEILTENPNVPAAFWPVDRLLHPTNCAFGYLLQTSVLDEAVFSGGNPLHV